MAGALAVLGCATGSRVEHTPLVSVPAVRNEVDVAVVTGIAAVTYVAAGGCNVADCPADTVCNPSSQRCVRIECNGPLAVDVCPAASQCSSATGTCVPF
jgi:hypothetical protein